MFGIGAVPWCVVQEEEPMSKRLLAIFTVMLIVGVAAPASADPQGFIEDEFEYGFSCGTFDLSPNVALFAGGTIEEF